MNTSCTKNVYYTIKWEGDIANLRDTKHLEIYDVLHYSSFKKIPARKIPTSGVDVPDPPGVL